MHQTTDTFRQCRDTAGYIIWRAMHFLSYITFIWINVPPFCDFIVDYSKKYFRKSLSNLSIIIKGKTMDGEIGLVADQIYEIWNCTNFVYMYWKEYPICVYIPKIQREYWWLIAWTTGIYIFVQLSHLAKNWHFFANLSLSIYIYISPHP